MSIRLQRGDKQILRRQGQFQICYGALPFTRRINTRAHDVISTEYGDRLFDDEMYLNAFEDWVARLPPGGLLLIGSLLSDVNARQGPMYRFKGRWYEAASSAPMNGCRFSRRRIASRSWTRSKMCRSGSQPIARHRLSQSRLIHALVRCQPHATMLEIRSSPTIHQETSHAEQIL